MIKRDISKTVIRYTQKFPVIALLGPRQSGKTTLSRQLFPNHVYVTLEDFDTRTFALEDTRSFLNRYHNESGIIFDEIQHVPQLLSYIQTHVDEHKKNGYFVITGSQNFLLNQAISQSLAGRVAILTLLPLSLHELQQYNGLPSQPEVAMFQGGYPRLHADGVKPQEWFPNYITTYIERDVRQIKNVHDVTIFQQFLKLCAGRVGQLLNLTSLGNDCGISSVTAKSWISLLQQSYIVYTLYPHFKNFSKRVIQTPKLYFYDTALACHLLGIESAEEIATHYLRGGLFESFIIAELQKYYYNHGLQPHLYFWRDKTGHEVDCIIEKGNLLIPMEIKAGRTVSSSYFEQLQYWNELSNTLPANNVVIYAGHDTQPRSQGTVVSWQGLAHDPLPFPPFTTP